MDLRAGPARTLFGALVEQALRIEFAQPVQGQRWPGAVTQQPLAPSAVLGLDAHRAVDGEATTVGPLRHRARILARQQSPAHKDAQQPPAHLRLHRGEGLLIEPAGGVEDDPARRIGREHAVDDHAMEVQMGIERRAKAVDEGDRAETSQGSRASTVRAQALLHHAQKQAQGPALEIGVAVQDVARALGYCQNPLLPHRQRWQDVISQMRCRRHHAPGVARGAHAAPFARERDQEIVPALPAPGPGKTAGEDAAVEVAAKLTFHIFRHRPLVIVNVAAVGEPGLEVLLDAAVEHALARMARPIPRSCAVPGPALDPHPCPRCPVVRRWGSGWAARRAGRHWPPGLRRAAEVSWP